MTFGRTQKRTVVGGDVGKQIQSEGALYSADGTHGVRSDARVSHCFFSAPNGARSLSAQDDNSMTADDALLLDRLSSPR